MTAAQILVVDDEQNIRTRLEAVLESSGYRVVLAYVWPGRTYSLCPPIPAFPRAGGRGKSLVKPGTIDN